MEEENNNGDDEEEVKYRCVQCRTELYLGRDVHIVEQGVIGPRGVVPLGDRLLFCSERCLADYFSNSHGQVHARVRRVP